MKTLKFVLAITIACCALTACVQEEEAFAPQINTSYVLATPIEVEGTMDILRDYIKVDDDLAHLDIDSESAKRLGVNSEDFDFFKSNLEKTNASVMEHKKRNPDVIINWVFESVKDVDVNSASYYGKYQSNSRSARNILTGNVVSEGGNWGYSKPLSIDSSINCFLCNCSAVPPASSYEVRTVFNNKEGLTVMPIDNYNNTAKTFPAYVADFGSGRIEFKANAVSGYLGFAAVYMPIQGI